MSSVTLCVLWRAGSVCLFEVAADRGKILDAAIVGTWRTFSGDSALGLAMTAPRGCDVLVAFNGDPGLEGLDRWPGEGGDS